MVFPTSMWDGLEVASFSGELKLISGGVCYTTNMFIILTYGQFDV